MFSRFLMLSFYLLNTVHGRGRMIDPPHRGSMWRYGFNTPPDYNDMSLNCGGISQQWKNNKGKCGLCGDPYDVKPREHEFGGKYATGTISKTYIENENIEVTIELTANKMGWFQFRLCANTDANQGETQSCLDKHVLKVLNSPVESSSNENRYMITDKTLKSIVVRLTLPEGVTCSNCILQFRYHAGNNYGTSEDGKSCLGCGNEQEELYNCADVEIIQNDSKVAKFMETNATDELKPLLTTPQVASNSHQVSSLLYCFSILILHPLNL